MTLPQPFVDAWMKALVELGRFPKGTTLTKTPLPSLVQILAKSERKSVFEMRDAFTRERDRIAKGYLGTRKGVVTYLLGFHLANLVRAIAVWGRTLERTAGLRDVLSRYDRVRVRDLGAGTGVMSQAIVHVWQKELGASPHWDFDLVDLNQLLIEVSRKMLAHVVGPQEERSHPESSDSKELTIITLGYFWNELSPAAKSKLLKDLEKNVKEDTLVFVAEPASEQEARDAMELRDMLVGLDYQVLYPCSHQGPCPMLRGGVVGDAPHKYRDRCYSEFGDKLPPIQQRLDHLFEMERTILAVSGYVFGSPSLLRPAKQEEPQKPVVVGKPKRKEERGSDYLLCREEGLIKVPVTERRESAVLKRGEFYGREIPKVDPPKPREAQRLREPKKYPSHKPKVPARKRPGVR